ncbi:LuxR family transcriptional regulator [Kocuria sp. cx-455]|uniref:ATP-binding protein n=1 Tax=unclassified Candidatus Sulfotelmatobacter TaxID=2635724 RepID=UPI00168319B1|nr:MULTISPECIES: LuxR C-terminal-related transcriptional regulator [unclassified Candidatus Sulfotelmatobacter]MBD2762241.1 LuxR family transcriptional regulator [Kocuria sp. cx-116]MBD2764203.1 LuxR family transcriptional regulator [Kocuria sp. cx-455]
MSAQLTGQDSLPSNAAVTTFVGRRKELSEARATLTRSRLTTLAGPGGVGKTRLGIEVTQRFRRQFNDGTWMVDLGSLNCGAPISPAVASTLAIPDQSHRTALERVVTYLRDKELLLFLDNCEHVLPAAVELVDRVLATAPGVKVLTTSREPLNIAGETVLPVPPLTLPSTADELSDRNLEQFESVAFLVDRARNVIGDFAITPQNRHAVIELCTRLDGMPLALEFAAARLQSMSVTQLLERLDQRFRLLSRGSRTAQPRHRTLQALIDWSYELCSPEEQVLWQRLTVFPGSFDLDAAEEVCGFGDLSPDLILDLLDRLVAKSILLTERTGETVRYRQLMTVREYGAERLGEGAAGELHHRHRDCFLRRAETMVAQWCSPRQSEFILRARTERHNSMAALEWSVSTPGELISATRLAVALRHHWVSDGYLSEGRYWLDRVLDGHDDAAATPERGAALWVVSWVSLLQGDHEAGAEYLTECRSVATALHDDGLLAHTRHWAGLHSLFTGDLTTSISQYERAVTAHDRVGDTGASLTAQFQLGMAQVLHGDPRIALATCDRAIEIASEHDELWNRAYALWISGICHWMLGDHVAAHAAATEALTIQKHFQDAICTALTIELLSWVAASTRDFPRALELSGAAANVWRGLGTTIGAFGPHIEQISQASARRVRQGLDPAHRDSRPFDQRPLSKEAAIEVALTEPREGASTDADIAPLTRKEWEVAELVAQGLTNRQVAQELVVSPRTVDGHVGRILTKLDFTSRMHIASWVSSKKSG